MPIFLKQTRPGEWALVHDTIDPVPTEVCPIPSWIVGLIPASDEDMRHDFARELARIYGHGRRRGRTEGRNELRADLAKLLTPED